MTVEFGEKVTLGNLFIWLNNKLVKWNPIVELFDVHVLGTLWPPKIPNFTKFALTSLKKLKTGILSFTKIFTNSGLLFPFPLFIVSL